MPRLVVPKTFVGGQFRAAASFANQNLPGDTYKDRLVKYIPAESVAFYTFADKLLDSHYQVSAAGFHPTLTVQIIAWFLLGLGLVGTPIYLYRQKLPGQPWRLNAAISTLAFVLWAYSLGGSVFVVNGWYSDWFAALGAPIFTFLAGMVEPRSP